MVRGYQAVESGESAAVPGFSGLAVFDLGTCTVQRPRLLSMGLGVILHKDLQRVLFMMSRGSAVSSIDLPSA